MKQRPKMHTYVYLLILLHAAFLNLCRSRFWYVLVHKQLEVGVIFTYCLCSGSWFSQGGHQQTDKLPLNAKNTPSLHINVDRIWVISTWNADYGGITCLSSPRHGHNQFTIFLGKFHQVTNTKDTSTKRGTLFFRFKLKCLPSNLDKTKGWNACLKLNFKVLKQKTKEQRFFEWFTLC